MQLAIHYPNFVLAGGSESIAPTLAATARAAEDGGCSNFTVMDHWFQIEQIGEPQEPMLEGYTALGFIAAKTERITIGLLVTGVTYRHPGLLAKTITTVDVLSGGRAQLGIGAAWFEREHLGLGVRYPPIAERFERLEEALQICNQMWSDDDGPYEGRHFQLAETLCSPQPIKRPRILIGGAGERKTLLLVARYGDACNLFGTGPDVVAHKLEVLARHCEAEGRDPAEIEKTILSSLDPVADLDRFLASMEEYARLGIDTVWVVPRGPDPAGWVAQASSAAVPRLAEFASAEGS